MAAPFRRVCIPTLRSSRIIPAGSGELMTCSLCGHIVWRSIVRPDEEVGA